MISVYASILVRRALVVGAVFSPDLAGRCRGLGQERAVVDFLSRWDVIVSFPVILFPSYMVAGYVRDGKLSCALERLGAEPTSVQIGYPSPTLRSSNVQAFVDACAKALTRLKFD